MRDCRESAKLTRPRQGQGRRHVPEHHGNATGNDVRYPFRAALVRHGLEINTRPQRFDSLAVEEGGNICTATLVRGGVSVFSPQGELVEFHEADEVYCTNICFGGADMRTAFITLSGTGRLIAVDWPRSGLALHDPRTARKG